jgi:hypothetical protein
MCVRRIGICVSLIIACFVFIALFFNKTYTRKNSVVSLNLDSEKNSKIDHWLLRPINSETLDTSSLRFENWYESLPIWLASNGFPAFVLPETQSLAVSLRAMYAETNTTPDIARVGGVLAADENLSRVFSNMFSESLSQRYLIESELSGRLFDATYSKIRSFNE